MRPETAMCVLILLYMCPHTAMCVSSYCYMCPGTEHATKKKNIVDVFYHHCMYVRKLLFNCPHTAIYICPHAAIYVSAYCYICVRILLLCWYRLRQEDSIASMSCFPSIPSLPRVRRFNRALYRALIAPKIGPHSAFIEPYKYKTL
jgi:hypothetical protein